MGRFMASYLRFSLFVDALSNLVIQSCRTKDDMDLDGNGAWPKVLGERGNWYLISVKGLDLHSKRAQVGVSYLAAYRF
ncbi:hypothetical protein Tco_0966984 [Tanacetum coccineum]